jgi:ubiquinol-cytochrome c reductase cytochrome b subunit
MSRFREKPRGQLFESGTVGGAIDDRFHFMSGLRRQISKVFPTHWSFMLGEIALYSFIVLLVTGTYLALFFDPSLQEITYHGSYTLLRGVQMSRAFQTTLDLSFEVRGGLFVRQIHHWAALLFVAAIITHMLRIFFTGAFRRPRETNWVIGIVLFTLGMVEGFAGYSLPDDLLSGTGLRIMSGIVLSIPVIGTWLHWLVFGGEYPGEIIDSRLYIVHVLLIPGLILALIAVHLAVVWYQKHTQFPGPKRTERNVVGVRILPTFALKSAAFFISVAGMLTLLGGVAQINPIWNYGPYEASMVSAGSQPDWYIGWLEGSLRLMPAWVILIGGHYRVPVPFWPAVVLPIVMIGVAAVYPWIEKRLTGDRAHHNLLQRPRDMPVRTGIGVMAVTFFLVLLVSGGNDIIADKFHIALEATVWIGRIALIVLPPLAYLLAYRFCRGLQRKERTVLEEGVETGILRRTPAGDFVEAHQPIGPVDEDGEQKPLPYEGSRVPRRPNELGLAGKPVPGTMFNPDPPGEETELDDARAEQQRRWERFAGKDS